MMSMNRTKTGTGRDRERNAGFRPHHKGVRPMVPKRLPLKAATDFEDIYNMIASVLPWARYVLDLFFWVTGFVMNIASFWAGLFTL